MEENQRNPVDEKIASQIPAGALLRYRVLDKVIELYKDRNIVNEDQFIKTFEKIYKLIITDHGTKTRE
jgi:hypothetical protein